MTCQFYGWAWSTNALNCPTDWSRGGRLEQEAVEEVAEEVHHPPASSQDWNGSGGAVHDGPPVGRRVEPTGPVRTLRRLHLGGSRTRVLPEEDEDEEGKVSRALCFLTMLSGLHQPPYCSGNTRDTESTCSLSISSSTWSRPRWSSVISKEPPSLTVVSIANGFMWQHWLNQDFLDLSSCYCKLRMKC